jgi:hypothetical protein
MTANGGPEHTQPVPADVDPSLLEVVPWSYGYAHSWALAALLADERVQAALLTRLPGLPGPTPHRVDGIIAREKGIKPARADLAFTLVDGADGEHRVAVETKVNDPFNEVQVRAYREAGWVPLLNLPGATGVLLAPTEPTEAGEIRLTPDVLLDAVESTGLTFARLLNGYLTALREEHSRAQRALALARDEPADPLGDGHTDAAVLADVAWLAETYRLLPGVAADSMVDGHARMRIEANDRGFFYDSSFAWMPVGGALWVDVFADIRSGRRAVAIKAGEERPLDAWDRAAAAGPPGRAWRKGRRLRQAATVTVWKRDLTDVNALDAATAAVGAAEFIRRIA